jgi:N-6 DNA Methylase
MSKVNSSSSTSTATQFNDTTISWNEIKSRTLEFQKTWIGERRERAEKDTFWNEFFAIFVINRRRVASFETAVRKLNNKQGFIDCFWEGVILIEHKSFGKDLDKAFVQATDYFTGLTDVQLPKFVLVSDFDRFHLYNLDDKTDVAFSLDQLLENIELFGFLAGYAKKDLVAEDPVNIQASVLMGNLHDAIRETGYEGYELEIFLTRILFVLFAEDTQIFEMRQFLQFIENRTSVDGFDTGIKIGVLFDTLNKPFAKRVNNLDQELAKFPYINGGLFAERIECPQFDSKTRLKLIECARFDWSKISPAVFGSLFQSVMNPEQRRTFGAHYTEEKNILKTIEPLFLDDLWAEFDTCKSNKKKLQEFHIRLSKITFLDPACGCGNFLIVTYRELRKLELQVLLKLHNAEVQALDVGTLSIVNVDQFYGIEIEEFPAQIAKTAMWLMDHIANLELSKAFGQYYARIPLTASATILHDNSLTADWNNVIPAENLSFIIGNPPFVGSRMMGKDQKSEFLNAIDNAKDAGELDYVCAWFVKAAKFVKMNPRIEFAFVSTNSIYQGQQVGILWNILNQYGLKISFAHQTFAWSSEAKGKANVFCCVVGFSIKDKVIKKLYSYQSPKADPVIKIVSNINPYLVEGHNVIVHKRQKPICNVPEMSFGNMPADGGEFLFTIQEKKDFLEKEPEAEKYFRKFVGSQEYINNIERWCLWLVDIDPSELRKLKFVLKIIQNVKEIREKSSRPQLANIPHLFAQITQNNWSDYIIIPSVSSEKRKYIPIGFEKSDVIASNLCLIIPNATLFHFGILTSKMHMAWVKVVCGRLESRFRYSKDIVYNNFPFPSQGGNTVVAVTKVEQLAQNVLDVRLKYQGGNVGVSVTSLADLYDSLTMPPDLAKAHADLDRAVEKCYRSEGFKDDEERVEFLFQGYGEIVNKIK